MKYKKSHGHLYSDTNILDISSLSAPVIKTLNGERNSLLPSWKLVYRAKHILSMLSSLKGHQFIIRKLEDFSQVQNNLGGSSMTERKRGSELGFCLAAPDSYRHSQLPSLEKKSKCESQSV